MSQSEIAIAASPVVVTILPHKAASGGHKAKSAPSPSPSASGSVPGTSPSAQPTASASATGTAAAQPTASASASQTASQDSAAAAQVLTLINQARASAGLPALTILSGLETSSSAHNMTMAGGCGLSHQCPGEPALGDRETAAGVHWTAAGENIGEGGPVADTSAAIAQMAVGLTQSMLDEKPPNDGHRQNILSSTFTHIGIAVYRDSSGTVWLTQDFSN
ncbi:MAG TPA: CAP domain-containing protein [Trebonia sp.]|nr:CAP domain-containing protein [Trebonia sp.]